MRNFLLHHARKMLIALFLLSSGFIQAQGPVAGYDLLGSCNGHYYYISTGYYFGTEITNVVTDFRNKTAVPDAQVYAASIVNATENSCITNLMVAYNTTKYGSPLASAQHWSSVRNPWIGFSDASSEGNFGWSNGQPNCENFINWNIGEPNNTFGTVSNGEDYTELLLMQSYLYNGVLNDPLGKWNDWFNNYEVRPDGSMGSPTRLPVIIEVGTADCPTVNRGNYGCSHGYWKNSSDAAWADAGYSRSQLFATVFGITNGRGVITINTTTLQNALELGGGSYNNLARQGVAALLNASRGFYPYTPTEIINAVKNMFNNSSASLPAVVVNGVSYAGGSFTDAGSLATYLDGLNNLGCPLNNAGGPSLERTRIALKTIAINGYPNPSKGGFNLQFEGLTSERAVIRVTDLYGRLVEVRSNVSAHQIVQIGENYRPGFYNVELIQGTDKKQLKLIKQ